MATTDVKTVEGWPRDIASPVTNLLLLLSVMSMPLSHLKSETFSARTSEYNIGECASLIKQTMQIFLAQMFEDVFKFPLGYAHEEVYNQSQTSISSLLTVSLSAML